MSDPKYIDANKLRAMMYHGAFEEDSDMQRWDGGCWIRYKMFEKALEQIEAADVEPARHWIPVTERLPEEDKEVLISYRYKEGEGNTSHSKIDITSYGQMYFGGNKVGRVKHWRAPFEYFESNYEVIAWMPLPEPYKGGEEE